MLFDNGAFNEIEITYICQFKKKKINFKKCDRAVELRVV